jgi:alkyl sulfatase BDS1-like metallo-beta-lactamase superfamily hydrolase
MNRPEKPNRKQRSRICIIAALLTVLSPIPAFADAIQVGIHPDLERKQDSGPARIEKLTDKVYVARAYDAAQFMFVIGDKGITAIDAGMHVETTAQALADLRKVTGTKKPIVAVLYTHGHSDHTGGVRALVKEDEVGKIDIYALSNWQVVQNDVLKPYFFMNMLRREQQFDVERAFDGKLMPFPMNPISATARQVSYLPPTIELEIDQLEEKEIMIDGNRYILAAVHSEIEDLFIVNLPDEKVVYATDTVSDYFPWIATARLEPTRRPEGWIEAADIMAAWKPNSMAFGHAPTIFNDPEAIQKRMYIWSAGIRSTLDQISYHVNSLHSRETTAEAFRLPAHLDSEEAMQDYHHSRNTVIRSLWTQAAGWAGGDAIEMMRHYPKEEAKQMVKMVGGEKAMLKLAKQALKDGDTQWTAQLTTYLIRLEPEIKNIKEVKLLKAKALRTFAATIVSSTERAYMSSKAKVLDGTFRPGAALHGIESTDSANFVEPKHLIALLPAGFDFRRGEKESIIVNLKITDKDEVFGIHMDRGVLYRFPRPYENADATISLTQPELTQITMRLKKYADMDLKIEGSKAKAERLFTILDL